MELREPGEETLGQVGSPVPVQLPRAAGQSTPSRAGTAQRSRAVTGADTAVQMEHSAPLDHLQGPAHETTPAHSVGDPKEGSGGQKAGAPSSSGMERGMSAALMSPGREAGPLLSARQGSPALTFASLIPQSSPLHARIAAQQVRLLRHSQHTALSLGMYRNALLLFRADSSN